MTTRRAAKSDTTTRDTAADTAAEQTSYPYLQSGIDPATLRAVGNTREVGDIRERRPDLVASVAEHGLNPMVSVINVAPDPDGVLRVLVGFHRTAAAVAVKELENPDLTIDALVHAPGTTRRDVLLAQGIENIHREGYTPVEEAGLYDQLTLEGLDEETIARQLARPVERVRAGRAVAAAARTQAAGQELLDADLFTLAQLAEFADHEDDHQQLVEVLRTRPRDLEFTIGQLRRGRAKRDRKAEEEQRLTEQGYTVIANERDLPDTVARLDMLCTGENTEPLDPDEHTECPGRAAEVWVDTSLDVEITEFCLDYAAHGHHTIASVSTAAALARLREQGVRIVEPDTDGAMELDDLFADEQAEHPLTAAEHAECAGHAAFVEVDPYETEPTVTFVCDDYATHSHAVRSRVRTRPERNPAFVAAERLRAGANNKLWRAALVDRREWLAKHFRGWRKAAAATTAAKSKGKTDEVPLLPARVHQWLALAPVLARDYLAEAAPAHRYACALLGLAEPEGWQRDRNPIAVLLRKRTTTDAQAVAIRLAMVIGACEQHWDQNYTKQADPSWRSPNEDSRFYFELLEAMGYPLQHIEQLINHPELDNEHWPHLAADAAAKAAPAA